MPTPRLYSSNSQETKLTVAVNATDTTIVVANASALLASSIEPIAGETYTVVIDPDTSLEEIVDVIYPSTHSNNSLTVVRGVETGGVGIPHGVSAVVRHMGTGRDFREANEHINQSTGTAHGLVLANVVETTDTGTVSTAMLAANAVTTAKITDANVTTAKLADSSVTTAKVADGSITSAKIADATIVTGDLADGSVTSAKIADGTIVNADINAAAAIDKTKIAGTAVTQADNGTVTSAMIADGTIATGDIADGAITSAKIADGTIATADLADGSVTSAKIADGTISNADISATAGISYSKLSLSGSITSADIVDGTIVASDIANGTITAAKMVADPYARANHTGTQTASTISNFDTQVRTSRLDQMAAPTAPVSANSQKITNLAEPTVSTDASTKGYVDTQVNALVNGAPGTLDTLGEIAAALASGGSVVSTLVAKAGDTMTGPLTLSGAPTSALHAATKAYVDGVAGSTAEAQAAAAAAAASYDSFDDRYLGAKSTPPTLDNDGNALITGAIYWNTVTNAMYAWTGTEWGSISSTADIYRYRFTATAGQTSVSGTDDNGLTFAYLPGKEQVYLNGILLVRTTDYTASNGTSITSLASLAAGDIVEIITFTSFELADAINRATISAKGDIIVGVAGSTPGVVSVGANGKFLKANSATSTGLEWADVPNPDLTPYATEIMTIMGAY